MHNQPVCVLCLMSLHWKTFHMVFMFVYLVIPLNIMATWCNRTTWQNWSHSSVCSDSHGCRLSYLIGQLKSSCIGVKCSKSWSSSNVSNLIWKSLMEGHRNDANCCLWQYFPTRTGNLKEFRGWTGGEEKIKTYGSTKMMLIFIFKQWCP